MNLVVVAGISGSGKTSVSSILSYEGYTVLENTDLTITLDMINLLYSTNEKIDVCLIINPSNQKELSVFLEKLSLYQEKANLITFYMYASDDVIIRRFKEAKREHLFTHKKKVPTIKEAIKLEEEIHYFYAQKASFKVDTSNFGQQELQNRVISLLDSKKAIKELTVHIVSFGFKYGVYDEADYLFDLRFLKNPFYVEELKNFNGLNKDVSDYVFSNEVSNEFYNQINQLVTFALENFTKQKRRYCTIAFGCTGGMHRSISFAERLKNDLSKSYNVVVNHKEIEE